MTIEWANALLQQGFAVLAAVVLAWWINKRMVQQDAIRAKNEERLANRLNKVEDTRVLEYGTLLREVVEAVKDQKDTNKAMIRSINSMVDVLKARPCLLPPEDQPVPPPNMRIRRTPSSYDLEPAGDDAPSDAGTPSPRRQFG